MGVLIATRLAIGVKSEHENMMIPDDAVCCITVTSSTFIGPFSTSDADEDDAEFDGEENMSPLAEIFTWESAPIFPNCRYCKGISLMFTIKYVGWKLIVVVARVVELSWSQSRIYKRKRI